MSEKPLTAVEPLPGDAPNPQARQRVRRLRRRALIVVGCALVASACLAGPRLVAWESDREDRPHPVSLHEVAKDADLKFPAGTRLESSTFSDDLFGEWELVATVDFAVPDLAWFRRVNALPALDIVARRSQPVEKLCSPRRCRELGYTLLAGERVEVSIAAGYDIVAPG